MCPCPFHLAMWFLGTVVPFGGLILAWLKLRKKPTNKCACGHDHAEGEKHA